MMNRSRSASPLLPKCNEASDRKKCLYDAESLTLNVTFECILYQKLMVLGLGIHVDFYL